MSSFFPLIFAVLNLVVWCLLFFLLSRPDGSGGDK